MRPRPNATSVAARLGGWGGFAAARAWMRHPHPAGVDERGPPARYWVKIVVTVHASTDPALPPSPRPPLPDQDGDNKADLVVGDETGAGS